MLRNLWLAIGSALALLVGQSANAATLTYAFTGNVETATITTTGLYRITVSGARGGDAGIAGGLGALVVGEANLTAGQFLSVLVGGNGADGSLGGGGGGGGGMSFVVVSDMSLLPSALSDPNSVLLVAGGGGGGGASNIANPAGNGRAGANGGNGVGSGSLAGGLGGANGLGGGGGEGAISSNPITMINAGFFAGGGGAGLFAPGGDALIVGGFGGASSPTFAGGLGSGPSPNSQGGFGGGGGGGAVAPPGLIVAGGGGGGGGGYSGGGGGAGGGGIAGGDQGGGGGSFVSALVVNAIFNNGMAVRDSDFEFGFEAFVRIELIEAAPIPAPGAAILFGSALVALGFLKRRRRRTLLH